MKNQEKESLTRLAELIRTRNQTANEITSIIGRPAQIGHVGEFIASKIFNITLEKSASEKAIDGIFSEGPLKGQTVNIKWYAKRENILDITPNELPDYYIVLTGPKSTTLISKGKVRPWVIETVYLFNAQELVSKLHKKGLNIGTATSIKEDYWDKAEIHPNANNKSLVLNQEQMEILALFT